MPSNVIDKKTYDKIREIVDERPDIPTRELARLTGLGRDTVDRWRTRKEYTPYTNVRPGEETLPPSEEHHLKKENQKLKKQINDLMDAKVVDNEYLKFSETMVANPVKVPKWKTSKKKGKSNDVATVCTLASDWHLDEMVFQSQIGGCNKFNRQIAEVRVANYFDNVVGLTKTFIKGIEYDGLELMLGGDIFSGNIHEELKETNESTIIESVLYWTPIVASGIVHLADNFNHVHIRCVVGNHGRMTRKPIAKNRAQDNFDFLFYNMLAMQLKDDDRITWDISTGADCSFKIYDTRFCLTHGDQFRGGGGISGSATPWALGDHKKRKRMQGVGTPYDFLVFGHWHQLTLGMHGMIVNGTLKGMDEYSWVSNYPFEVPQQALWLVQPKYGITGRWPVHVLGEDEDYLTI